MSFKLTIDFDFDAFEGEVYAVARAVFTKLQRDYSNETFYTFNLVTGDVSQYVTVFVDSEEELTRNASEEKMPPGLELALEDRRYLLRHSLRNNKFNTGVMGDEVDNRFSDATSLLLALQTQVEALEDSLIDDENMDDDEFDDFVYEEVHEPVEETLKWVMQRLDREGVFEVTNARENMHLGVLSSGDRGELLGPFTDLNPASACSKYSEDVTAYQNARNKLDKPQTGKRGCRWFGLF